MTDVVVFTPTNRFGIDVTISSLKRQTHPFVWCVADELLDQRQAVYDSLEMTEYTVFTECEVLPGNKRALAQAYNNAAELALYLEADLFISLQDYIWIPDNGIELFVELYEKHPECLVTGLVSHSERPEASEIVNPLGLYTIFSEPFTERPEGISWRDARDAMYQDDTVMTGRCSAEHWEANWASVPVHYFKKGARWDLEFDKGMAYENMDFARTCERDYGGIFLLDKRNHALSLPHFTYWPEDKEELERHNNRKRYEEKWG